MHQEGTDLKMGRGYKGGKGGEGYIISKLIRTRRFGKVRVMISIFVSIMNSSLLLNVPKFKLF
jgi:hypothetical protein